MKKIEKTKKLTKIELLELENAHLQQSVHDLELKQIDLQKQIAQKDLILMGYQIKELERSKELLNSFEQTIKNKRDAEKTKYVKIIEGIQKRLGIEGKFGYDPDSGEIN